MFNFVRLLPIGDNTTKPKSKKSQKLPKIGVFSPPEGDRIKRSTRNLACKRRLWVCYSTPNLALIGQRASIQEPPKLSKFVQNCGFYSARNARIASAVLATAIPSVCLSVVCPSVTRRYCVKTTAPSTVQFAPLDSKMCLVL